jgi:hypothetical protein
VSGRGAKGFMPGMNPRPTARIRFSSACGGSGCPAGALREWKLLPVWRRPARNRIEFGKLARKPTFRDQSHPAGRSANPLLRSVKLRWPGIQRRESRHSQGWCIPAGGQAVSDGSNYRQTMVEKRPQGLKPTRISSIFGTTKVVPKKESSGSSRPYRTGIDVGHSDPGFHPGLFSPSP